MVKKAAAAVFWACLVLGGNDAQAAIFRLQSSADDTQNTYDYGVLTFSPGGGLASTAKGEIKINTQYIDSNGAVVPSNAVADLNKATAWNITINNGSTDLIFRRGYNTPILGSLADTSVLHDFGPRFFELKCDSSAACGNGTTRYKFVFGADFNDSIGNSVNTSTPRFNTVASVSLDGGSASNAQAGQLDFVPLSPALVCFAPVAFLVRRLKSRSSFA